MDYFLVITPFIEKDEVYGVNEEEKIIELLFQLGMKEVDNNNIIIYY
jgi:hypothetical protein